VNGREYGSAQDESALIFGFAFEEFDWSTAWFFDTLDFTLPFEFLLDNLQL